MAKGSVCFPPANGDDAKVAGILRMDAAVASIATVSTSQAMARHPVQK